MNLSIILNDISNKDIENIYDSIRGRTSLESGLMEIEKIKSIFYTFRSQFLSKNDDPSMHRTFVSLYKKMEDQAQELETYIRHRMEFDISSMEEDKAMEKMANIHLLINSLRSFAGSIDKRT